MCQRDDNMLRFPVSTYSHYCHWVWGDGNGKNPVFHCSAGVMLTWDSEMSQEMCEKCTSMLLYTQKLCLLNYPNTYICLFIYNDTKCFSFLHVQFLQPITQFCATMCQIQYIILELMALNTHPVPQNDCELPLNDGNYSIYFSFFFCVNLVTDL